MISELVNMKNWLLRGTWRFQLNQSSRPACQASTLRLKMNNWGSKMITMGLKAKDFQFLRMVLRRCLRTTLSLKRTWTTMKRHALARCMSKKWGQASFQKRRNRRIMTTLFLIPTISILITPQGSSTTSSTAKKRPEWSVAQAATTCATRNDLQILTNPDKHLNNQQISNN